MTRFRHILAATDLGPASARVVAAAVDLAASFGALVTVLHVARPRYWVFNDNVPEDLRTLTALRAEAAAQRRRGRVAVGSAVRTGAAAEQILAAARELGADLIVAGSHGRLGVARTVLGSVAEALVRASPVPVLTIHPFWFESRAEGGRAVARLLPAEPAGRAIVAISRGGAVVGAEIARALNRPMDVLLTGVLVSEDGVLGAVCEDGTTRARSAPSELGAAARRRLAARVGDALRTSALRIRGSSWIADEWRRDVVLVSDAITEPWTILAAAEALRGLGAASVVAASPVVVLEAAKVLQAELDGVIAVHELDEPVDERFVYAEAATPSDADVAACLRDVAGNPVDAGARAEAAR